MTVVGQRDARFNRVNRMVICDGRYILARQDYQTLVVADYDSGPLSIAGESADVGAKIRAVATDGTDPFVLTDDGVVKLAAGDEPTIDDSFDFNPGDGHWLVCTDGVVLAPVPGGVQVVDLSSSAGRISSAIPGMASCVQGAMNEDGLLCVADQVRGRVYLFEYDDSEVSYLNYFAAPNCRDVIKVIAEATRFLVVCKRRVLVFDIDGEELELAGTVKFTDDLSDMVPVTGGYWLGVSVDSSMNPFSSFFGLQLGLIDDYNMVIVSPEFSHAGSTDETPFLETATFDEYVTEDTIVGDSSGGGSVDWDDLATSFLIEPCAVYLESDNGTVSDTAVFNLPANACAGTLLVDSVEAEGGESGAGSYGYSFSATADGNPLLESGCLVNSSTFVAIPEGTEVVSVTITGGCSDPMAAAGNWTCTVES